MSFRYSAALPLVLDEISFEVPPLGMTAIVGPSGAGKTTTFSLIERFYDPIAGVVAVDGHDVRDWRLGELREAIGYVEQDAPVLSGTLRENLRYGAPEATDAELDDVLATTRLAGFVAALPERLDRRSGTAASSSPAGSVSASPLRAP